MIGLRDIGRVAPRSFRAGTVGDVALVDLSQYAVGLPKRMSVERSRWLHERELVLATDNSSSGPVIVESTTQVQERQTQRSVRCPGRENLSGKTLRRAGGFSSPFFRHVLVERHRHREPFHFLFDDVPYRRSEQRAPPRTSVIVSAQYSDH
jgi:hypothetical protein